MSSVYFGAGRWGKLPLMTVGTEAMLLRRKRERNTRGF